MDQKVIEELKAQHGEIHQLSYAGVDVIVRAPSRAAWKRYRALMSDAARRADSFEVLLRDCLLHPSLQELDGILDRRPGLAETFGAELVEIAGLGKEAEKKVL